MAGDFIVNDGTVTLDDGTVITGDSPAVTLNGGTLILQSVTAQTATNSPTIVVNSGSLVVRDSTIQGSTGYAQPAILITGGSVDLGTAANLGGNIINVSGAGEFLQDSTSGPVPDVGNTLEVNGAPLAAIYLSLTPLGSSSASSVYGQPVIFTASVEAANPTDGAPSGSVDFVDTTTGTDLGTATVTNGAAILTTVALAVGSHTITANYEGDSIFAFSLATFTQTVQQDGTTAGLTASPTSTTSGQPVTLTATIAAVAPGAGTPTGSVQFFIGTTSLGTASLSGNTAILTTTTLPLGTDSVTAKYLGDANFTVSTSSAVAVTIDIATTTTLTSSMNPSIFGQSVTFTATVTPSSGNGTPTGSVSFYDGSRSAWHGDAQWQKRIPQDTVDTRRFAGHHRGL